MTEPNSQQSPQPASNARSIFLRFFAGLLLGTAVSAVIWLIAEKPLMRYSQGGVMLAVPGTKLAIGVVFLFLRGWRSFGAGILVSIAIGALIFLGACASHPHDF